MPEPVAEHCVVAGVQGDQEQQDEQDQDPSHRVPWLVAGHDDTHGRIHERDAESRRDVEDGQLVDESGQRHGGPEQYEHQGAEDVRGDR
jgi:hypothetical protein